MFANGTAATWRYRCEQRGGLTSGKLATNTRRVACACRRYSSADLGARG